MKLLCEEATFNFIPAIRALITKELMHKYNYTQTEVAKAIGVTQPAISQYKKELRGQAVKILEKDKEIADFVSSLCAEIVAKSITSESIRCKFCDLCKLIGKKKFVLKETNY